MPKHCPPNRYNAALELAERDPEAGLEALHNLARKYPSDPSVRHALGVILMQEGETAEALAHLEAAAKRSSESEAHAALAVCYARLDMIVHAVRASRRAHQLGATEMPVEPQGLDGDLPEGASEKDLLEFERARFEILEGSTDKGVAAMKAFVKRFPDYQPALNILATGAFVAGDMAAYREAATSALERAPHNIHALLNYARLKLLTEGPERVRELVPRIAEAPTSLEAGIAGGELAQAQAFALVGDDEGVERALENLSAQDEGEPVAAMLMARLRARHEDAAHPYHSLHELMPGVVARWRRLNEKQLWARVKTDMHAMPGVLALVPSHLGFEDETFAKLFALMLLEVEDLPAPHGPWPEVVRRVAQEGPGTRGTRLALLQLLTQKGLVSKDEPLPFAGVPGGVRSMELELYNEPAPSPLTAAEEERVARALELMREGRFGEAREILAALHACYPENPSLTNNLALAEIHDAALEEGEAQGRSRLERLAESQPDYLFARAHLAGEAIERGDLERARALLAFPEGVTRLHVQEYATYTSALGRLAVAEGRVEEAEEMLELIGDILGEDSSAYMMLEQTLDRA